MLINDFKKFQGEFYKSVKPDDCYWSIGKMNFEVAIHELCASVS